MDGSARCTPLLGFCCVELRLAWTPPEHLDPANPPNAVHVHLALDVSGSMAGAKMNAAKEAVAAFVREAAAPSNPLSLASLHLLPYHHEVQAQLSLLGLREGEAEAAVRRITAGGGTSFAAVLAALEALAAAADPADRHVIVFFTDGQDYSGTVLGPLGERPAMEVAFESIQKAMRARGSEWQVHCLGFGADHDAAFLSRLTLAGSEQGSFAYISDPHAQLAPAMDRILQDLEQAGSTKRLRGTLHLPAAGHGGGRLSQAVLLLQEELAGQAEHGAGSEPTPEPASAQLPGSGPMMFTGEASFDCPPQALLGGAAGAASKSGAAAMASLELKGFEGCAVEVPLSWGEASMQAAPGLALRLVKHCCIVWTSALANQELEREGMLAIRDRLTLMRQEVAELQARTKELLPLGRGAYRAGRAALLEAAGLLNQFESKVVSAALGGTLSSHAVAQLNDLAYRDIGRAQLRTRLERRVVTNLDLQEEVDRQVEEAVRGLAVESLPPGEEWGCCAISCCDYREALQAGDCLCLGLDVERPEAAIMDPSRLVVKYITPTRISAQSFMDALALALAGAARPEVEVHGGFQRGAGGQVVAGQAREAITGALPLFINDQHWRVARLLAKPLFGWMCTLNPLGYTEEQMRTVPFLVLGRALRDLDTEAGRTGFKLWVAEQALQTSLAVYRGAKRRLLGELVRGAEQLGSVGQEGMPEGAGQAQRAQQVQVQAPAHPSHGGLAYLRGGPAARTLDVVPSTEVWLLRLLCAVHNGDVALAPGDWAALRQAILEEELRRCQSWGPLARCDLEEPAAVARLLGVDPEAVVAEVMARWDAAAGEEEMQQAEMLAGLEQELERVIDGVDWAALVEGAAGAPELAAAQRAYADQVAPVVRLAGWAEQRQRCHADADQQPWLRMGPEGPPAALLDWLPQPALVALLLQNGQGVKNATWRAYIEAGSYVDPILRPEELLRRHFKQVCLARVRACVSQMHLLRLRRAAAAMAAQFAAATTVDAAAAAIQGWSVGRNFCLQSLLGALLGVGGLGTGPGGAGVPLPAAKMRLLMGWAHGGCVLRADRLKEGAPELATGWVPSRRTAFHFLRAHWREVGQEEALALFGRVHRLTESYLAGQYAAGFACQRAPAAG